MADNLREILDIARREMTDIPPDVWPRLIRYLEQNFAGERVYVQSRRKGYLLEALASQDEQQTASQLAAQLGVSVRTVRRYKKIT